jgi:hypothetical protein
VSSTPQAGFDPYDQWLGIPPGEQPPDHYRLLGVASFESDAERIEAAADERMRVVCKHLTGPHAELTHALLAELAAARDCLMSLQARSVYDGQLRQASAPAPLARVVALPAATSPLPPPVALPIARLPELPPASQPLPTPAAAASSPVVSRQEIAQESDRDENPRMSLRSFVVTFLGMAAAVVLVALATYGIGRLVWLRTQVADRPVEKKTTGEPNSKEVNPGDHSPDNGPVRPAPHGKKAVVVMQEGSQDVNLTPATAALFGSVKLQPTGGDEFLDGWSRQGDQALWTFKLLRPGFFRLELTYAALDEAGETTMAALIDDVEAKNYSLSPSGALTQWRTLQHTIAVTTGGQHTLAVRLEGPVDAGSLVLKGARLAPVASAAHEQD